MFLLNAGSTSGSLRTRAFRITFLCLALMSVLPLRPIRAADDELSVEPVVPVALLCGGSDGRPCALSLLAIEPDYGAGPLIARFNEAVSSIDLVPFELDDPGILRALADARQRGVQVRVLIEPEPSDDRSAGRRAIRALQDLDVETRNTNPTYDLTHNKYAIIDRSSVVIPTSNFTSDGFSKNRDFALVDSDPANVAFIQELFEADWDRRAIGAIPKGFVISPENSNVILTGLVDSARSTITLYAEKLQASPLLDALLKAARRGVTVRIIASNDISLDKPPTSWRPFFDVGTVQVHVLKTPRVHAKLMVIDGAQVFLGSVNVEDAPREKRRELGILFAEPTITGQLMNVFEWDWVQSPDVYLPKPPAGG